MSKKVAFCDVKGRHEVYVTDTKFMAAKSKGISVSALVEAALDNVLSDSLGDFTYEMQLSMIDEKSDILKAEMDELKKKHNILLDEYNKLQEKRIIIEEEYQEQEERIRYSKMLAKLNPIIVINNYKEAVITEATKDLLLEIVKIKPDFELKKHIELIKRINA